MFTGPAENGGDGWRAEDGHLENCAESEHDEGAVPGSQAKLGSCELILCQVNSETGEL